MEEGKRDHGQGNGIPKSPVMDLDGVRVGGVGNR